MDANKLSEIEEIAALQFTEEEIVLICETELNDETKTAIIKGRLKAEAEARKAILQMAKQGSTPAQKQFLELVQHRKKQKTKQKISC